MEVKSVNIAEGNKSYVMSDGIMYSSDMKHLVRFSKFMKDGSGALVNTPAKAAQLLEVPDCVEMIDPYAFTTAGKMIVRFGSLSQLKRLESMAFYCSGVLEQEPDNEFLKDYYGWIEIPDEIRGNVSVAEDAFEDADYYYEEFYEETSDSSSAALGWAGEESADAKSTLENQKLIEERISNAAALADADADQVTFDSMAGDKSLYDEKDFELFNNITEESFTAWSREYLKYNEELGFIPSADNMPYTILYKGNDHYRSMSAVLNHEPYRIEQSIKDVGDDFENMYIMMDHGLFTELERCKIQDRYGIVLYSGLSSGRANIAAGIDVGAEPSKEELTELLAARVGEEYVTPDMMSTTASLSIAAAFSSSEVVLMIYSPKDKLDELGSICVDSFNSLFSGEQEILFSGGAQYRILDVGKIMASGEDTGKMYVRVLLLGKDHKWTGAIMN